jgi:hypothetical protein
MSALTSSTLVVFLDSRLILAILLVLRVLGLKTVAGFQRQILRLGDLMGLAR